MRYLHNLKRASMARPWNRRSRFLYTGLAGSYLLLSCWLLLGANLYPQSSPGISPRIVVMNDNGAPLAGVEVRSTEEGFPTETGITGADGRATLLFHGSGRCDIRLTKAGFMPVTASLTPKDITAGPVLQFTLTRTVQDTQAVTVHADNLSPLAEPESSQSELNIGEAKMSPLRPATLVDTLPLVPGVARTPDGRITIEGTDEAHSTLLINSVNVTDPATGNFGLSIPVDSVDIVKVSLSPYLAQYGSFTAGVVSAETRRGGDKWDFNLNDPLPEFRIRSGHLEGLRSATPRIDFGGPLVVHRVYLLEGTEYLVNKAEVRTLPYPMNQIRTDAFNSFTQFDGILAPKQTLTATLHFAPHNLQYVNLNYFDPEPVTPNADYQEDTGTVLHRWAIGSALLTSTFSVTRDATNIEPQTPDDMVLTPVGNSGSYFGSGSRQATRYQWLETWSSGQMNWHGKHFIGAGSVIAHAEDEGAFSGTTTLIQDATGRLLRKVDFTAARPFELADLEPAVYMQDHWLVGTRLALDLGIRAEAQTLTSTKRLAPRGGLTWTPEAAGKTVIRGGIGVFYNEVPLDTYAFASYPNQVITTYDGYGRITDGPRSYLNLTSTEAESQFPFISQKPISGNFAPYGIAWNVEGERAIGSLFTVRVRYLHSDLRNQITLLPEITADWSALVLGGSGQGQLRQFDLTAGIGSSQSRIFFLSYVRQVANGDQTDAASYLGDFPFPVVHSPILASNAGEIPNRLLVWGTSALPWRMRISPRVELRDGFPYQPTNSLQDYVDLAAYTQQPRFPRYFTVDARTSKDFSVGPKHAVRLSVSGIDLTNHLNPLQVHSNVADPHFGSFFGNYGRHFLLDFDVLF